MKHLKQYHLFLLSLIAITILSTGCWSMLASSILYQNDAANKTHVPEVPPAPLQKIDIREDNGDRTVGWYFQSTKPNAPVVIYFHGNGENLGTMYENGFTEKLQTLNINFVVFDYPKYGLSLGELNQKGVLKSGQAIIDFVKIKFPNSRLVLWGRSLGAAPATLLTEANSNVEALILTSPWTAFWKLVKHISGLPESTCKSAAKGSEYNSESAAKNITVPVLIHHGTADETIPFSMGQAMAEAFANPDVVFSPIEGAGHNNLLGEYQWAEIYRFISIW